MQEHGEGETFCTAPLPKEPKARPVKSADQELPHPAWSSAQKYKQMQSKSVVLEKQPNLQVFFTVRYEYQYEKESEVCHHRVI